jgi:hypothetical protein
MSTRTCRSSRPALLLGLPTKPWIYGAISRGAVWVDSRALSRLPFPLLTETADAIPLSLLLLNRLGIEDRALGPIACGGLLHAAARLPDPNLLLELLAQMEAASCQISVVGYNIAMNHSAKVPWSRAAPYSQRCPGSSIRYIILLRVYRATGLCLPAVCAAAEALVCSGSATPVGEP